MWFVMTCINVALLLMLFTQLGSWEYQTSVWHRNCFPFCVAKLAT
jgi:hypothetical protein